MSWAYRAGSVTWGHRTTTVRWPPVDDRVEVVDHRARNSLPPPDPTTALPRECAGIDQFLDYQLVNQYEASLGESSGGVFLADTGELVLQVTDDPWQHRNALSDEGAEACVIEVTHSEAALDAVHDQVPVGLVTSSWAGARGRLTMTVAVADAATAREIATHFDDPTMLRIVGEAAILDG